MKTAGIFFDAFYADCRDLTQQVLASGSRRLQGLTWCGWNVLDICRSPTHFLKSTGRSGLEVRESHGQLQFQPVSFKGAFEGRASRWFLPELDSSPLPTVSSKLADAVSSERSKLAMDFEAIHHLLGPHPDHAEVVETGDWQAFIVSGPQGLHDSLRSLPRLWCLDLIKHSGFCANFGFCMFLRMGGGSALLTHVGSTNLRLRCQLGISAPEDGEARLTVGESTFVWQEGDCVVFDDSYPHSARNDGIGDRVVFSIDAWHPGLTSREIEALSAPVFSRFGKVLLA